MLYIQVHFTIKIQEKNVVAFCKVTNTAENNSTQYALPNGGVVVVVYDCLIST